MPQPPVPGGPPKPPAPAVPRPPIARPPGTGGALAVPSVPPISKAPTGVPGVPPVGIAPAPPRPGDVPVSAIVARAKAEQEVLNQIERLPSLPTVIFEVMRIANNPKSSATDFEGTLRQDQILTARVLKLVNSSFFARQRKITTVSESVVVLGFNTLKSIVTAASAAKVLSRKMEGYGYAEFGLWKHSFATALSSKVLATALKVERAAVEEVFIAGLLHDIGKLVLDPFVRQNLAALKQAQSTVGASRIEAERAALGFDHAEIGVKVAKRWNLPAQVEETIAAHHAIENAREQGKVVALVALADHLMNAAGVGLLPGRATDEPLPQMVLDVLAIQGDGVAKLKEKVDAEMDNIRALCDQLSAS